MRYSVLQIMPGTEWVNYNGLKIVVLCAFVIFNYLMFFPSFKVLEPQIKFLLVIVIATALVKE